MPKIKIAIIATTLVPPHPAGTQIMQVLDQLHKQFDFTVFAREIDPRLQGKVKFIKVPIPLVKPLILRYTVQFLLHAWNFKKRKLYDHFDIIHVIEASSPYGNLVTMQYCGPAAKILMKTGVVQYKGWRRLYYKILIGWGSKMEQILMTNKYLKGVIVPSRGLQNDLLQYYPNAPKGTIIPNGVNMDQFKNARSFRAEMRRNLGIMKNEFVGIIAGLGDWERKGLGAIIDAISILKNEQVKIVVVGGNTEHYKTICREREIDANFVFVGITKELEKYYGLSDFFILPTANEAWSVVTLMAAAAGLPLLATKVNGVEDFIVEGSNGYFIERNGDNIAEKIRYLKSGAIDLTSMGQNSAHFAKDFDVSHVAEMHAAYYKNFISEKKPDKQKQIVNAL